MLPRTQREIRQLLRLLPRYRVLLYAGPGQEIGLAVEALLRTVPSLTEDDAVQALAEAQALGVGEVIVCLKEHAEHYCDELGRQGLNCEIEPA
jgi:ATP-dependent Clp protease adaptor protein ClpS